MYRSWRVPGQGDLDCQTFNYYLMICFTRLMFAGNYTNKDKPFPRGEILLGGGNVVQGYYKNPEQTKKDFITLDNINYFCTGDIGQFEADGSLRVIGK